MNRQRRILIAGAALAALGLSACGGGSSSSSSSSGSGGGSLTEIKVAYTPITAIGALIVGQKQGFFSAEGLELALQQVDNPPAGIAAVAGGQVDFNYAPTIPVVNAVANGVKIKIAAPADGYKPGTTAAVTADPSAAATIDDTAVLVRGDAIKTPADLAGKTVAVPARGAQLEVTTADAIKQAGGDPSTVKWITLDFPSALSSLKSGRIDAAGVVQPFISQGESEGDRNLVSPGVNFFGDGAVGVWVTSDKMATDKADVVAKYQRAVAKTNAYANDHLDEVQAAAADLLKIDLNTIKTGAAPYFSTEVTTADVSKVVTKLDELGYLKSPVDANALVIAQP